MSSVNLLTQWTNIKNIGGASSLGHVGTFVTEVAGVTSDVNPNYTVFLNLTKL